MDSRDKGCGEKRRKGMQFTTTSPSLFCVPFCRWFEHRSLSEENPI